MYRILTIELGSCEMLHIIFNCKNAINNKHITNEITMYEIHQD